MFNGNKLVLILPAILMVLMFFGGYHFLGQVETMTHEELEDVIELDVHASEREGDWVVRVNWDWTMMPDGGMYGEDYVSVAVLDSSRTNAREDVVFEDAKLELIYADEVIYETMGQSVDNGMIFEYPNELDQHKSYGNVGQMVVTVSGSEIDSSDISVKLLHTWVNHSPLTKEDAQFTVLDFSGAQNVPHWIIEQAPKP
ncbi:hypothetical protein [Bacillus sp. FJAT-45037]|uniref:hypothetical protein n=1 Tax=Bacillus sp. FJAT-45037 TaxID=2011007 RepID=UPI000C251244|nr:hypothetical protein [Bacillus sp. FJAT-45037]